MATFLPGLLCLLPLLLAAGSLGAPAQAPLLQHARNGSTIAQELFWELEELARIVDISYCVGTAGLGIQKPFQCASRCADADFETFELVTVSRPAESGVLAGACKLIRTDLEYRTSAVRLVRLHCRVASSFASTHHSRLSRHLLHCKYHRRPVHGATRICPIPRRRR